uniref:Dynein heavy chain C-terminal domain-containing protein n=1 Tax=Ditylum brightwellii TaxID=49249 RepID=A0A7S4VZY8_9STRA
MVAQGRPLENKVNFTNLFSPGAYLSALRQQTAKSENCSMHDLRPSFSWNARYENLSSKLDVIVEGLVLQGGKFDGTSLEETHASAPDFIDFPPMIVSFVRNFEPTKENFLQTPLYSSSARDRLLMEIPLPCSKQEREKLILASIALFVSE